MTDSLLKGPVEWDLLSNDLKNQFTLNGRVRELPGNFIRENTEKQIIWPRNPIINTIFHASRRGNLQGCRNYNEQSVYDFYKVLDNYSIAYKDILVIGSQSPWIEVICLAFGAKLVTTVDYNPPVSEYEEIRTIGVEQLELENSKFDVLISYSSLEHDGLGRYGDPIDPEGDLKRMKSYLEFIKPDGLFFLGVPCGKDALCWNANRTYGEIRFPMLTEHWDVTDIFFEGYTAKQVLNWELDEIQPWWVLKPKIWFSDKIPD